MAFRPNNKYKTRSRYTSSYSNSYSFKNRSEKPLLFATQPKNTSKRSYSRRRSFNFSFDKFKPVLFLGLAVLIIFLIGYFAFSRHALAVVVNGEPVGYIRDVATTEDEINGLILAKLKEDAGNNIELNERVTLEKVNSMFKHVSNNAEDVLSDVCKAVTYKQEACTIIVEGQPACIVANIDTAKQVLKQILDNYNPPKGTSEPEFATQIKTESTFVNSTKVLDIEAAVKLLSQTRDEERIHTVVSGDTFASIAANAGMTEAELLKANPSITSETKSNLSVGQQIKVIMTVPTLTIRTYKIEKKTETIPYETERESDNSMSSGETKEVQAGVNGQKEITQKVAYINGIPQGTAATQTEKVIKEPVSRIIKVGTYEPEPEPDDEDDDSYYDEDDSSDDDNYDDEDDNEE
jgi:peptidase M23